MRNFIQEGNDLTLIAPSGGVVSGGGYKIGQIFVVATVSAEENEPFTGRSVGVFELNKIAAQAWTPGELIYWDESEKEATATASGNFLIGAATEAAENPSSVGNVKLNGVARGDVDTSISISKRTVTIGFADLTDADGSQSINIGAALPATAVVVGHNVNCTAVFDNAGDTATFSVDIGVSGALDSICNGASLNAIANVNGPLGARSGGRYPSAQLLATVLADVDVTDATKGSVVIEVFYFEVA